MSRTRKKFTIRIILFILVLFLAYTYFFGGFIISSSIGFYRDLRRKLTGYQINKAQCRTKEKYYLTILTIVKNAAKYLPEWIEFHQLNGVEHFYIYDNESQDELMYILEPYIKEGLVTYKHWGNLFATVSGVDEMMTQKYFLKDGMERFACETKWMALIDVDEFLFPTQENHSLPKILNHFDHHGVLSVSWIPFVSSGHLNRPEGLVISSYTTRWKRPMLNVKNIVQPKRVYSVFSIHKIQPIDNYCRVDEENKCYPFSHPVLVDLYMKATRRLPLPSNVLTLNHYYTKSVQDWEERYDRGDVSGKIEDHETEAALRQHWNRFLFVQNVESSTDCLINRYTNAVVMRLKKRKLTKSSNKMSK